MDQLRKRLLSACALLLLAASAGAATAPSDERGLSSDTSYQLGDVDHINLFNGNLSITIPLGKQYPLGPGMSYGLNLVYNSNGWVTTEESCLEGNDYGLPQPDPRNNAGFGWRLSLGQLIPPNVPAYNNDGRWAFISPDGGEHLFTSDLHPGYSSGGGETFSFDSTYLRMRTSGCTGQAPTFSTACRLIEAPDGTRYEFRKYSAASTDWKLQRYADVHGNALDITYGTGTWTLDDAHGRQHTVQFNGNGNVASVTMEGVGTNDVVFDLQYSAETLERQEYGRPAACTPAPEIETVNVQKLDRIVMPDESYLDFTYYTDDSSPGDVLSGGMASLRLPAGGEIRYTYRRDIYISEVMFAGTNPLKHGNGIATRSIFEDPDASATGTWTYDLVTDENPDSPFHSGPTVAPPCFHTRVVTDPIGNVTEHFFTTVRQQKGWAYGLPLTFCDPDTGDDETASGPWVSQRLYDGTNIAANLVREVLVEYTADGLAPLSPDIQGWNTRMTKRVVVYHDDPIDMTSNHQRQTTYSDFDGLGHWRTVTTSGTFGPTKTVTTDWNDGLGTLTTNPDATTASGFTMPSAGADWVWGLYTERTASQGGSSATTEAAFDATTGVLERQRVRAGSSPGDDDVLRVLTRNASGYVTAESLWGGEGDAVDFDDVYSSLADMTLPTEDPEYRVVHTYSSGVPSKSEYVNPCDETEVYLTTLDQDIDASSGLPVTVRDSSGFETDLEYDEMFRVDVEKPEEGAWTVYSYDFPTVSSPSTDSKLQIQQCQAGIAAMPCNLVDEYSSTFVMYDRLGRVERRAIKYPKSLTDGDDWKYTYNALGWKTSETTWGRSFSTTYSNFDRFGRPGTIQPPGGEPAIQLAYVDDRLTSRETEVETSAGARAACHREQYDHFGRLVGVRENFEESSDSCLGESGDLTSYLYDEQDRLTQVCSNDSGSGCGQTRTFSYDGRGVLTSEVQPEIGPSGNGTVSYTYDSMGNVLTRDIAGSANHSLRYRYDGAGRLTHVDQKTGGSGASETTRQLKEFRYARDNSLGSSRGKLIESIRWNWVDLTPGPLANAFTEPGGSPVQVVNRYRYSGTGGRISRKVTTQRAGTVSWVFRTHFSYTHDGLLDQLTYPECLAGPCAGAGPARTVNYDYSKGFLTKVNGYATDFDYQYGGMLHKITYANGATWTQTVDPANHIPRPQRIEITTGSGTTTFGNYDFDGAGNITTIGSRTYHYDLLSRLTSGQARDSSSTLRTQTASFDTYGNLTTLTTAGSVQSLSVNAATNRLSGSGMSYDEAGNLTNATIGSSQFQYTWDGLNSMKFYQSQVESKVFSYDAAGERLETFRCPGSSCGEGESYERLTLRGLAGEVLRVFQSSDQSGGWVADYIYADGRPLARVRNDAFESGGETAVTEYLHLDHLGSVRLVTDASNAEVAYHEYFPFGEEATSVSLGDSLLKFTGHERDDGPGLNDELDYMHARYCGPSLGRFLSVDPIGGALGTPQSWNRYAMVLNRPLVFTDPRGQDPAATFEDEITVVANQDEGLDLSGIFDFFWVSQYENIFVDVVTPFSSQDRFHNLKYNREIWGGPVADCSSDPWCQIFADVGESATAVTYLEMGIVSASTGVLFGPMVFGGGSSAGIYALMAKQPLEGAGASHSNISASDARRIQNAANRLGEAISLVGSRASGKAGSASDFDFVIRGANSRMRHSAASSLPEGPRLGIGAPRNQDIFSGKLQFGEPHIVFFPGGG